MKRMIPDYKMTVADLCMFVSNLVSFMKKDAVYFAARGVSMNDILAFEALGNAYEVFPSDLYYMGGIFGAVDTKNNERKAVFKMARDIMGYFIQAYGAASEQYKRLSAGKFAISNDNAFVSLTYDLVRIAVEALPELSAIGLTQLKIDSLASAAGSLESKVDAAADAKALRRSKTIERIEKGNELYAFVKLYTTLGKLLAAEHREMNYKSYLIYRYRKKNKRGDEIPG